MPNVINTITKFLPLLDEQYRLESKSAILDTPAEFVLMTKEAKKVKIAKITSDNLADYSRNGGFVGGSANLDWEEHTFTIDRGRALQIDAMDNVETMGLAWGRLAGNFQKEAVIPEMDAIRFSKYYAAAGIKYSFGLTNKNILGHIDDIVAEMDDAEVPEGDRILFCNPKTYKLIVNDESIVKHLSVDDNMTKALNKKIYSYNEMPIIKVPSRRFYEAITLLDGTTNGQETGGYVAAGKVIGVMIVSKSAVVQLSKRAISRFWAPTREEMDANRADGVNPSADAWKFDYRNYHDAWVLENKTKGIAVLRDSTGITSVTLSSDEIVIANNASAVDMDSVTTAQLAAAVVKVGDITDEVAFTSDDVDVATVSEEGLVTFKGVGVVKITAKAVADETKYDYVDITVTDTGA